MKHYFAPFEGISGYIYRNAHHTFFGHIDKYFTPFLAPTQNQKFLYRELQDILPEHNEGLYLVPQILTNNAGYFIWCARELKSLGYKEVNLNLGCPAKTVVSKHRGAGFLSDTKGLDIFLDQVFSELDMKISIKTRIGKDSPEEFYELLEIFNKYPMEELIIHPRIQTDFYKNKPNLQIFKAALDISKNPVCYNGDIFSRKLYEEFTASFPSTDMIMLGRGLLANPGLSRHIQTDIPPDKDRLKEFHDVIYHGYQEIFSGGHNTLFKMKELWSYMITIFTDHIPYMKKIKKAQTLADYDVITARLFREQDIDLS